MKINWKGVIRDVIIIWMLTFIGGFIVGIAGGESVIPIIALAASNILCCVVGFTISGCIVKANRFKHLLVVAICFWVTNLTNIPLGLVTFVSWVFSIINIFITMAIGGALSFIFVRAPRSVVVTESSYSNKTSPKEDSAKKSVVAESI